MRDKRLANVEQTKQSIYSVSGGYSVFFDLPDDCLWQSSSGQGEVFSQGSASLRRHTLQIRPLSLLHLLPTGHRGDFIVKCFARCSVQYQTRPAAKRPNSSSARQLKNSCRTPHRPAGRAARLFFFQKVSV